MDMEKIQIGKNEVPFEGHSLVLAGRSPGNKNMAILFVTSGSPGALPGLSRKLPHYHKYSYLVFEGDEPVNIAKGRWPVHDSPMSVFVPGKNGIALRTEIGKLNRRKPLITIQAAFSSEQMMETVRFLSGDELKGRALGTEEIDQAAEFIAEKFREAGLKPLGDPAGSYFQTWEAKDADNPGREFIMRNVVGVIPGKNPEWSGQSVVVGAHYDHLGVIKSGGTEQIYHGADDNASGIAVLIELSRMFGKDPDTERSVVFVAFTGEENGKKGSEHYVAFQKHYPVGQTIGMLNLDTVGRLGEKKLLVIGADSAKEWEHIFRGAGYTAGIEVETVSGELDSSDQQSFQAAGIPAVQLFTGPHPDYHKPTDTAEKIDFAGLVKVASVAKEVVRYLAGRQQSLTNTISSDRQTRSEHGKERRVSLGIIPDFAFRGAGCRVSGVLQGSPAEKAGIKEGDIIVRMNSAGIRNLKDLSDALKDLHAGDDVSIVLLRNGGEMRVKAGVIGR
jgi:acetylornithine deacetylase/succinyl-diaminopimelate desuccinylase-like protein